MKLTCYLDKLKYCREKDFDELGVYDNYPIALSLDISQGLLNSGKYIIIKYKERDWIAWKEGTVLIQYLPKLDTMTRAVSENLLNNKILQVHLKFQQEHFSTTLFAYPYQEKKIRGISNHKALARVIEDIGQYSMNNQIGLCLPRAVSGDISWASYPSHIIYSDNLDNEVRTLVKRQRQKKERIK